MKILIESITMQGDFACDVTVRYGDISLDVSLVGNELQLPEFVAFPQELREQLYQKILATMCRERRKAA